MRSEYYYESRHSSPCGGGSIYWTERRSGPGCGMLIALSALIALAVGVALAGVWLMGGAI